MKKKIIQSVLPIILFALGLDALLQFQLLRLHQSSLLMKLSYSLSTLRSSLESEITGNLLVVQGVANYIAVTPDMTAETFERYAHAALQGHPHIKNIGAAPGYVIRFVYPREGNESVIGLDYRNLLTQWEQVRLVGETGRLVVAGPLSLVQGGIGLIGRAPVKVMRRGEEYFWGVVSSVIDVESLFLAVGIGNTEYQMAIRHLDKNDNPGKVFWGDPALFGEKNAAFATVAFPSGKWQIAGFVPGWWLTPPPLTFPVHGVLLFFAFLLSVSVYRTIRKNHIVDETKRSLDEAQAVAHLGSWRFDRKTYRVWWSDEMYRIFGVDKNEYVPSFKNRFDMVHPDDIEMVSDLIDTSLSRESDHAVEYRIMRKDNSVRYVQGRFRTQEEDIYVTGTILDITERKEAEEKLRVLATTDALTGVYNRRRFLELGEQEAAKSKRYGVPLAIFMLDIDHFKNINDTFGHAAGDRVLQKLAQVCLEIIRTVDLMGRMGGEEFLILMPHTDLAGGIDAAERVRLTLEKTIVPVDDGKDVSFTVSIGVAQLFFESDETLEALVKRADIALYDAKRNGRNRVEAAAA